MHGVCDRVLYAVRTLRKNHKKEVSLHTTQYQKKPVVSKKNDDDVDENESKYFRV